MFSVTHEFRYVRRHVGNDKGNVQIYENNLQTRTSMNSISDRGERTDKGQWKAVPVISELEARQADAEEATA